ncbi:MAG: UDP-3-O-acyl-N-acetylglucosamine deacetylase, partial [Candidatus Babeliales bacterium]
KDDGIVKLQKTLAQENSFCGIGVHSGKATRVTVAPAGVDQGIRITSVGSIGHEIVIGAVVPENAMHATVIKTNEFAVSTVEHLLAAMSALGIDNAQLIVQGQEIPIIDGSALPFVQGFARAGMCEQGAHRQFLTPKEPLCFTDQQGRELRIEPAVVMDSGDRDRRLYLDYRAEFKLGIEGAEVFCGTVTPDFFIQEIAPARTFGFVEQLPFLRQHGLALGTSLGNTLVIGQDGLFNDMRMPDECVRHKVLDLIGDLALLGKPLAGSVRACKTGHNFNRKVVEHYLLHPDAWDIF